MNRSYGSMQDADGEEDDIQQTRKITFQDDRLNPTQKFKAHSIKSSGSSVMSGEDEIIDDEDKDIIMKLREFLEEAWEWPSVRDIRLKATSYRASLIFNFSLFMVLNAFIFLSTYIIPGKELDSITVFNGIHIGTILSGHILFAVTEELLKCIHLGIVCSKVSHSGAKISEVESTYLSNDAPGYSIRQANYVIAVVIGILLSFLSINYQWSPISTNFMSGPCIPSTYPQDPPIYSNLGDFMQGDVDFALVYNFGIPLDDGIVGGWSTWPLVNPGSAFSTNGAGYIYAMFVNCGYTYDSAPFSQNISQMYYDHYEISGNTLTGRIKSYMPSGSILSDADSGYGVLQDCIFVTKFGQGEIKMSFVSDEWEMVAINEIVTITVGDISVTQRDSGGTNFIDFANGLTGDNYNLTARFHRVLLHSFGNASFASSQGASFSNILSEGTLPDGYYHENITWKGISNALAVAGHYVLMQYDQSAIVQCEYFGYVGAGTFMVPVFWVTLTQVLVIILAALCGINVWWMYLMFDIDQTTDIAYRTMQSNLGFCSAISKESEFIFANYCPNIFTLPADISHDLGKVKLFFGIDTETLENQVKEVKYGPKHRVLFMKKYFRRKKKLMKAEIREKKRLKEAELKLRKFADSKVDQEVPQIVIAGTSMKKLSSQPQLPQPLVIPNSNAVDVNNAKANEISIKVESAKSSSNYTVQ
ncbi:hypothetical protein HDV06_000151 [Boothiomyces sp. JEL0866]|nr:hypothetical protein HDV06_000151 [Boothiomyces sp. JEL0866]